MKNKFHLIWWKKKFKKEIFDSTNVSNIELLLQAGKCLKNQREKYGLSIKLLARKTMITTAVIEAIEQGWVERLPEAPYLSSMLPRLELELGLPKGSLKGVLKVSEARDQYTKKTLIKQFTPGSIDVLRTWQGSVAYALVILGSLIALNYQQRLLSSLNSETFNPFSPDITLSNEPKSILERNTNLNNLRPLEEAISRSPEQWFRLALKDFRNTNEMGILEIKLNSQKILKIESSEGIQTNMNVSKGILRLKMIPPVSVEIKPLTKRNEYVKWNNTRVLPQDDNLGIYLLK